ncbi:MAG: preprotein translocase subunit YajC [Proteobacteria bacterium]|nr:preprotein translocase subunit YajC [Pseudomonadota bacterium]
MHYLATRHHRQPNMFDGTMIFLITLLSSHHALAQSVQDASTPSTFEMLVIPVGFLVLMYLLFIRPQTKKLREQKQFLDNLKPKDEIMTSGGIIGSVVRIVEPVVEIDIGCGMIRVMKQHIVPKQEEPHQQESSNTTNTKKTNLPAKPANHKKSSTLSFK